MKTPANLVWALTRKHSAFRVKRDQNTTTDFNRDPTSLTNQYNATDAGVTNTDAISVNLRKDSSKTGKWHRRVFELKQRHKSHHGSKKNSGLVWNTIDLKQEVDEASKSVDKLQATYKRRKALKARLYKLHKSDRQQRRKERAIRPKF